METDSIPPPVDFDLLLYFLLLVFLLILSALISGSEVAFFSLKENPSGYLNGEKNKMKKVARLLSKPQRLLATILITNNFVNISIVIISAYLINRYLSTIGEQWRQFLEVVLITAIILMFGEILPKIFATKHYVKFAQKMAPLLSFLDKIFSWMSIPMVKISSEMEKHLATENRYLTKDDLNQIMEMTKQETTRDEQRIFSGIINFGNTEAKQVMKPRMDIFALDINTPFHEVISQIREKGYSRIPVYENDLDHIKGILFAKDLIVHLDKNEFPWQKLLRPAFFVPENIKLDDLLREFQKKKTHLAIVVDEYGGTSGIVTLEDVIEEVLGQEIQDEYDQEKQPFRRINKNTYIFDGKTQLKDFYKFLKIKEKDIEKFEQNKGGSESLAGFILEKLGYFPQAGEEINFGPFKFIIHDIDGNRINKIKVIKKS